jgi:hypothetical protein
MKTEQRIQKAITEHIKIRDKVKPCIFCGQTAINSVNGHFCKRRNAFSRAELYLANSNGMCYQCNIEDEKEDYIQQVNFRANMVKRYGEDLVNEIEYEAIHVIKNSISDKMEILKEIKKLTKKLC